MFQKNYICIINYINNFIYYISRRNLPSNRRFSALRCQLLTTLIKESVRSVKSFMTTERTNSKINNVTLLVISSESILFAVLNPSRKMFRKFS